ncbi:hypothetical protein THAOC_17983 [Thalassiosira oceanica]|uniref:Uncharacterized protein n=1 Tax=Thalassiosira oceanica TaxID=159749 RepID=K0S884_THAOC|nr:hypothetical protein THAOC_17983 [Thalassiosira oceanica]|eukprot:EJK61515.1 hypothetical protein THAOC_17983 [Thalassiosira oceanica]
MTFPNQKARLTLLVLFHGQGPASTARPSSTAADVTIVEAGSATPWTSWRRSESGTLGTRRAEEERPRKRGDDSVVADSQESFELASLPFVRLALSDKLHLPPVFSSLRANAQCRLTKGIVCRESAPLNTEEQWEFPIWDIRETGLVPSSPLPDSDPRRKQSGSQT